MVKMDWGRSNVQKLMRSRYSDDIVPIKKALTLHHRDESKRRGQQRQAEMNTGNKPSLATVEWLRRKMPVSET